MQDAMDQQPRIITTPPVHTKENPLASILQDYSDDALYVVQQVRKENQPVSTRLSPKSVQAYKQAYKVDVHSIDTHLKSNDVYSREDDIIAKFAVTCLSTSS